MIMEGHEEQTTQPISQTCGSQDTDEQPINEVWGKLYPLSYRLQEAELTMPVYKVGRGMECDLRLTSDCIDTSVLNLISKVQFEIKLDKDDSGIELFRLTDLSSNGTFVNKKKIGRNKTVFLKTSDEISLSQPQNKAFLFVDARLCNSWLPASEKHRYDILTDLGSGAFGVVKMAVNKETKCRYAIKKLLRDICENEKKINEILIANEIKILSSLDHAFIVKLVEVFENEQAVFMVLEYMPGGDLKRKLCRDKRLQETECKILFYQLFLGVQYLHRQGVTHRDLKPENILLSSENGILKVKISDFGLSKLIHAGTALKSHCGTLLYTAPEIIMYKGTYTPKVDVWSLGCMLYLCLCGKTPFSAGYQHITRIEEQIVRGYYKRLTSVNFNFDISTNAVNLVEKMLIVNSEQRFSIDDILNHDWTKDKQVDSTIQKLLDGYLKEDQENLSPDEVEAPKKMRRLC